MERQFNDGDREKRIVTSDGQNIGRVSDVHDGRATVEHSDDDSLTDEVKEMLGWSDDEDDEPHELHRDHVSHDDDGALHLQPRR